MKETSFPPHHLIHNSIGLSPLAFASILGYWIRKIQSEDAETECVPVPVFARLSMEQELDIPIHTGIPPVTILLPENIRIEVGSDCPARLMAVLL